ncbi:type II toxin-antitoxin system Phd/YefM family antitoxin [Romboutsia timonensis]|uniref:type II toxin-antitoxin system Phd/YefM family antitoxin n=1 Tax=Romboutsia timonensis TaxID=1776391 RepID=UPI002A822BC2|nr:type II toxin-antitoxin system Phd/YefM family antitoxin [Romboutsia timonensis]MDY3960978.1 type II toxin-antitoxin system Phd/YefM family antitoxin [Romboutsia timonensis]
MNLYMTKDDIVSASEVVKNFPKLRNKVKENSKMVIFKNNKPDLVLFDFEEYEKLLQKLEMMEDELILRKIEERDKEDNGVRHSFDDIKSLAKQLLAE